MAPTKATPSIDAQRATVALRTKDGSLALLAYLPAQSNCPSFAGFSATDLAPLFPPPYDPAVGYTRLDGMALLPSAAGAQCTKLAFALGEEGLVRALL